jgi:hypothetical protein
MVAQEPLKFLAQVRFLYPLPNLWKCGRVRFIAPVLKTDEQKCSVSSNLTASANIGELGEWLNQRFAKPSFRNGCISSNLILSAKIVCR